MENVARDQGVNIKLTGGNASMPSNYMNDEMGSNRSDSSHFGGGETFGASGQGTSMTRMDSRSAPVSGGFNQQNRNRSQSTDFNGFDGAGGDDDWDSWGSASGQSKTGSKARPPSGSARGSSAHRAAAQPKASAGWGDDDAGDDAWGKW